MALHNLIYQHDHYMNAKFFLIRSSKPSHFFYYSNAFYNRVLRINRSYHIEIFIFIHTKNVMVTPCRFESQYIKQKY